MAEILIGKCREEKVDPTLSQQNKSIYEFNQENSWFYHKTLSNLTCHLIIKYI